jgi:hypothetical protein
MLAHDIGAAQQLLAQMWSRVLEWEQTMPPSDAQPTMALCEQIQELKLIVERLDAHEIAHERDDVREVASDMAELRRKLDGPCEPAVADRDKS